MRAFRASLAASSRAGATSLLAASSLALVLAAASGCGRASAQPSPPAASSAGAPATTSGGAPAAASAYAFVGQGDAPAAVGSLQARFSPPEGFTRVPVAAGSFGAFLRGLPLAAAGTPVVTHQGKTLHPATHPNIAAVAAIDVGKADLQQCADSVIRLHAEWRWSLGRRDEAYTASSGQKLSFAAYLAGERHFWKDGKFAVKNVGPVAATHAAFRTWLDEVFSVANTASLAKEAKPVAVADLAPGDFVVVSGVPFGHAVLVLDLATDPAGARVALLGQGYMPAQSFQVLRRSSGAVWFPIDAASGKLETPFWEPFPWTALRRLD